MHFNCYIPTARDPAWHRRAVYCSAACLAAAQQVTAETQSAPVPREDIGPATPGPVEAPQGYSPASPPPSPPSPACTPAASPAASADPQQMDTSRASLPGPSSPSEPQRYSPMSPAHNTASLMYAPTSPFYTPTSPAHNPFSPPYSALYNPTSPPAQKADHDIIDLCGMVRWSVCPQPVLMPCRSMLRHGMQIGSMTDACRYCICHFQDDEDAQEPIAKPTAESAPSDEVEAMVRGCYCVF